MSDIEVVLICRICKSTELKKIDEEVECLKCHSIMKYEELMNDAAEIELEKIAKGIENNFVNRFSKSKAWKVKQQ